MNYDTLHLALLPWLQVVLYVILTALLVGASVLGLAWWWDRRNRRGALQPDPERFDPCRDFAPRELRTRTGRPAGRDGAATFTAPRLR